MAIINEGNETLHRIEAKLYPNYLGKGDGAYVARVKAEAPLSIEAICKAAKNRGAFSGEYADMVEYTRAFVNETVYQLMDGYSVQIGGFFSLHTGVHGTYNGGSDHIKAESIHVSFRTLKRLKDLLLQIHVENQGIAGDGAFIDEITDAHTDSLNNELTPGGMLRIAGSKIRVGGEGDEVGVWFVSQTGEQGRTKVNENFAINKDMEVVAMIPALEPGTYKLEIVTAYSHGGIFLKEPRTIKAEPILTVL